MNHRKYNRRSSAKLLTFITLSFVLLFGATTQAACPVPPAAYYPFDTETTGPYLDMSGNGNNIACTDDPGSCPTQVVPGQVGNGQDWATDTVRAKLPMNVPSADILEWSDTQSFSIEFWFQKSDKASKPEVIVGRYESSGDLSWWLGLNTSGQVVWSLKDTDGAGGSINSSQDYTGSAWHHVVAVRDYEDDENRLYVDGELVDTATFAYTSDFDAVDSEITLGYSDRHPDDFFYGGLLDELAFTNTALDLVDVIQHYYNSAAGIAYCDESAPQLIAEDAVGAIGFPVDMTIKAAGNPSPTYALGANKPEDMAIDTGTGEIDWVPADDDAGDHSFTVTASNTLGDDTGDYTITVSDVCSNLIGYWRLDTDNPSADGYVDETANGNNGECASGCPGVVVDGWSGNAGNFGTGTGINIPVSTVFDLLPTQDISFELWVRRSAGISDREVLLGRRDETNDVYWYISLEDTGFARFLLRDSTGTHFAVDGTTNVCDSNWHHIVAVKEGGNLKLYVDGALDAPAVPASYTGTFASSIAPLNIGFLTISGSPSLVFPGYIDEVAIYSSAAGAGGALSEAFIKQHFMATDRGFCNRAPVITAPTAGYTGNATEGTAFAYTAQATDAESDDLTWSLVTAPVGMSVATNASGDGEIDWTPGDDEDSNVSVEIQVKDAFGGISTRTFSIDVATVNDAPVITAQAQALATRTETALTIPLSALTVTDPDNDYPADFSLQIQDGNNYTHTADTLTPVAGFEGDLTVPVVVNDGEDDSNSFDLTVTVTDQPIAPQITGQAQTLTTAIDTPLTIVVAHLTIVDPDSTAFTLTVQSGANYTVNGTTITPDSGFSGDLSVPVSVNDGDNDSNVFTLTITVSATGNSAPVISTTAPATATVGTEYSYDAEATDSDGDTLTWSLSANKPTDMTVDAATGLVTWTPPSGSEGDVTFTLTVSDGNGGTAEEAITITVSGGSSGGGGGGCFITSLD